MPPSVPSPRTRTGATSTRTGLDRIFSTAPSGRGEGGEAARRRPGVLLLGLVVTVSGGLAGLSLRDAADHRTTVLVLTRTVDAGSPITADDLTEARVAVPPGVAVLPAAHRDGLIGKIALTDLPAGALPGPDSIGDPTPPTAGEAMVVLALPASRVPASGLRPGQHLLLVSTDDPTTGPAPADAGGGGDQGDGDGSRVEVAGAASGTSTTDAVVVQVGAAGDSGDTTPVDVAVRVDEGPLWAALAAAGRVTVVVQSRWAVQR